MCSTVSKIFEGYKNVGLVTSGVSHIIRNIDKLSQVRVISVAANGFHVYNNRLRLIEACVAHEEDINVLASDSLHVHTAASNEIFGWKFGHRWKAKSFKGCLEKVTHILPFGPHLIAIDEENVVRVWEIRSEELVLTLPFSKDSFDLSAISHPATYVNKILLGSRQGQLQLWNIRTQKCVYTFKGWSSHVTCLTQAPAVDVVAIGCSDGSIYIHNLKCDETILKFKQEWGSVLAMSFRADGKPHLVSSSPIGNLAIWNLEKNKLEAQMRNVHQGAVMGMNFVNNEPLLVTNSTDNSLKVWCFDQSDSTGRVLYQREGHSTPPSKIRFHGAKGLYILSAGLDATLRAFSIFSERLNKNLGTASYDRKASRKSAASRDAHKMPPIIDFTSETCREKEWDGIASCHRRTNVVTTWSFDKTRMGEHKLLDDRLRHQANLYALCVCLTSCGNFVIIGYNNGHVDKFNIQSGIFRGTYGNPKAHESAVQGVASDSLNQMVVTGGIDCALKFWRFKTRQLLDTIILESSINQIIMHTENNLLAASMDNFSVCVIDAQTRRIVREFGPHGNRITDMTFNAEGRWLITASMDSVIRVWDLPCGQLIDAFRVATPCVSLSLSPTGEFLATAHADDLSIYLWSNMTLYCPVTFTALKDDYVPQLMQMPAVKRDDEEDNEDQDEQNDVEMNDSSEDVQMDDDLVYKSPEQLEENLITLSLMPQSRWKNLLYLDLIKQRNKPKEPVKKPTSAPFFLPTIAGLEPKFAVDIIDKEESPLKTQIIDHYNPLSALGKLLKSCCETCNYNSFYEELKSLGPSSLDAEIRLFAPDIIGTNELLIAFLEFIYQTLSTKRDYELIQSYLGLFLKIHAEAIASDVKLRESCDKLIGEIESTWSSLENEFNKTLCVVNYLRSALL